MKLNRFISSFLVILLFVLCVSPSFAQLQFIENKGQWDSRVNYKAEMPNGAFFIERNGFTVLQHNPADLEELTARTHGHGHSALWQRGQPQYSSDFSVLTHCETPEILTTK